MTDELDACRYCRHHRERHRPTCDKLVAEFGSQECGCEDFEEPCDNCESATGGVCDKHCTEGREPWGPEW